MMRMIGLVVLASFVAPLASCVFPCAAIAAMMGQHDDFQDSTTQGWTSGSLNPVPPVNESDGGPNGAGDAFLRIRTTGMLDGAGSRLIAFNLVGWLGDFLGTGMTSIAADVRNPNSVPLSLRVGFEGPGGQFVSSTAVEIAAQSDWQPISFPIGSANLAPVGGGVYQDTMSSVATMRLLHNPEVSWFGAVVAAASPIAADLDVDNIRAVLEPSAGILACAAMICCACIARLRGVPATGAPIAP